MCHVGGISTQKIAIFISQYRNMMCYSCESDQIVWTSELLFHYLHSFNQAFFMTAWPKLPHDLSLEVSQQAGRTHCFPRVFGEPLLRLWWPPYRSTEERAGGSGEVVPSHGGQHGAGHPHPGGTDDRRPPPATGRAKNGTVFACFC